MKNITISLNDDVARWARIWAAEHDMSLSAMVSRTIEEMKEKETHYQASKERFFVQESVSISDGYQYPDRDSLHDR